MIENITSLRRTQAEQDLRYRTELDRPELLHLAAFDAARTNPKRVDLNYMLGNLAARDGSQFAQSIIDQSLTMQLDERGEGPEQGLSHREQGITPDLWVGVEHRGVSFMGAVMVQRGIVVSNASNDEIASGTCVEAWTVEKDYELMEALYRSGVRVAETIADGQKVFAIEPAVEVQKSKLGRIGSFLKPQQDPEILKAIGKVFAFKTDLEQLRRSDIPGTITVAQVFFNEKLT